MIPPDHEIFEVERRLALRRQQLGRHARQAGTRAMQGLASPVALLIAAGLGFVAAGGIARKQRKPEHPERRRSDHTKAAKASGVAGLLMTGAMWFIRARYGSTAKLAQVLMDKYRRRSATSARSTPL